MPGTGEIRAHLSDDRPITAKVVLPEGLRSIGVEPRIELSGPGLSDHGELDSEGRFRLEGIPEGTWLLEVRSYGERGRLGATRQVKAGSEVQIDLAPQ